MIMGVANNAWNDDSFENLLLMSINPNNIIIHILTIKLSYLSSCPLFQTSTNSWIWRWLLNNVSKI